MHLNKNDMPHQRSQTLRVFSIFLLSAYLLIIAGCAHVRLLAEYDENIDQGITTLQKKTEDFLSRLEKKVAKIEVLKDGSEEKERLKKEIALVNHEEFYREFRVDLRVLRSRAESYSGNDLTVQQLNALEEILKNQEIIHGNGFQTIGDISTMRKAFTRGFKGILKLEIAKKRGKE